MSGVRPGQKGIRPRVRRPADPLRPTARELLLKGLRRSLPSVPGALPATCPPALCAALRVARQTGEQEGEYQEYCADGNDADDHHVRPPYVGFMAFVAHGRRERRCGSGTPGLSAYAVRWPLAAVAG
ncbi:hypothetical protein GCM10011583_28260 [Streptomyces camponoticapitis]|uniref:Uncharacterized protein n=1 Tax=Streptomyces camponoticapitis TaxID=1616125 RepID=A0ABQ2E6Z3_9ACTN|nr:hypothetical protein GCM10011583_28260 [Streptomyces camponoticapitis]